MTRTVRAAPAVLALAIPALAVLSACDSKNGVTPGGAPTVTVLFPDAGTRVSGVAFEVLVDATDDDAVDRVEFSVPDGPAAIDDVAPFTARIVTLTVPADSVITVRVEAFDRDGQSTVVSLPVEVAPRVLTQLTSDVHDDSHPAWSPDGERIAFQADRDGAQLDLWIMDADGGNARRLTANVNEDRHPAFSPDGAWIAFDSDRAGTFDLWLLPLATGEADAESLTFGHLDDVEPSWSPGGAELFFASSRGAGDFNIHRLDVATLTTVQITAYDTDERAPAVSIDGRSLAFASDLGFSEPHVYTMRLGEIAVSPLTGDIGVTESDPVWIPDTDTLLFTRSAGLSGTLWLKTIDVESVAAQVTFGTGVVGDGGVAWHPDGDRIAFHSDRSGNLDIWLIR